jgi:GYF domain 2
MYKIIGGDQKQYGPVSTDEVRAWIAEGRLNAQTLAWAEGATDWKPLGSFPEFADALRAKAASQFAQAALPPGMAPAYEAQIFALPPQLRIGHCLERSWALWKSNFALLSLGCLVYGLIGLCQLIPGVGFIYWIFKGVFEGGLYLVFIRRIRGQPAAVTDVFAGFSIAFVQLLLVGVVSGLLGVIGVFCCCILPGIYLMIAWTFGVPLVVDKNLEFWSALELSRKVVTRVWFQTFGLTLLVFLPSIVGGALLYTLGGASSSFATTSAIHDILSSSHPDMGQLFKLMWSAVGANLLINFIARIIVIINLPFAAGALMYAYEDLFGTGRAPTP